MPNQSEIKEGLELRCIKNDETYIVGSSMMVSVVNETTGNVVFWGGVYMPISALEYKLEHGIYQKYPLPPMFKLLISSCIY